MLYGKMQQINNNNSEASHAKNLKFINSFYQAVSKQ